MQAKTQRGFTLIELVVVVLITAILVGLGLPSLRATIDRNAIQSEAKRIATTINLARSQAINNRVVVTLERISTTAGDWSAGWIDFIDSAGDGITSFNAATDTLLGNHVVTTQQLTIRDLGNAPTFISFTMFGRLNQAGPVLVAVCDTTLSDRVDGSLITVNLVGRVTVTTILAANKAAQC
ncbi:MAG: GspH/FimT family pseudopilin [Pseudomonadales bacterium]